MDPSVEAGLQQFGTTGLQKQPVIHIGRTIEYSTPRLIEECERSVRGKPLISMLEDRPVGGAIALGDVFSIVL